MKPTMFKLMGAGAIAMISMAGSVQAASITVLNSSFEAPVYSNNGFGNADSWVTTGNAGTFRPTATSFVAIPDGDQVGYVAGGSLQQTTSAEMVEGYTYTLSVYVGDRLNNNITDYTVALTADGATVAFDFNNLSPANGEFLLSTVTYTAQAEDAGKAIGITLSASAQQTNFDDVQLSSVPLPAAAWLFLSALGGLFVARRKQLKA